MFSIRLQNIFWTIFNSVLELLKEYDGVFPARWINEKENLSVPVSHGGKKKNLLLFTGLKLHYHISINANMLSTDILNLVGWRTFVHMDLV